MNEYRDTCAAAAEALRASAAAAGHELNHATADQRRAIMKAIYNATMWCWLPEVAAMLDIDVPKLLVEFCGPDRAVFSMRVDGDQCVVIVVGWSVTPCLPISFYAARAASIRRNLIVLPRTATTLADRAATSDLADNPTSRAKTADGLSFESAYIGRQCEWQIEALEDARHWLEGDMPPWDAAYLVGPRVEGVNPVHFVSEGGHA